MSVSPITAATTPATAAPAAAPRAAGAVDPEIRRAAQGLEGLFLSQLVDQMMATTSSEDEPGAGIYSGLMSTALGDDLAATGGFGLAAMLERQMMGGTS